MSAFLTNRLIPNLIGSLIIVGSALTAPLSPDLAHAFVSNDATQAIVELSQAELLGVKIDEVAKKYKIASTTLANLVESESGGDSTAIGDHGCSFGLAQINICAHKGVSKAEAHDPDFALDWTAQRIAEGNDWWWSSCNCYSYVQANFIKNLPLMDNIRVNTNVPHKGDVAIFWYKDRTTGKLIKHIAYVVDELGTIKEANKTHCMTGSRTIHNEDPYLAGYWDPRAT